MKTRRWIFAVCSEKNVESRLARWTRIAHIKIKKRVKIFFFKFWILFSKFFSHFPSIFAHKFLPSVFISLFREYTRRVSQIYLKPNSTFLHIRSKIVSKSVHVPFKKGNTFQHPITSLTNSSNFGLWFNGPAYITNNNHYRRSAASNIRSIRNFKTAH